MCILKVITFLVFILTFKIRISYQSPGIQHCIAPGVVALTFDDAPAPNGGTENVLKVLKEKGVKATFFITGNYDKNIKALDENQEMQNILHQMFQAGHQIGSHSWSHQKMTTLSNKEIRKDMSRLEKAVQNILGINMTVFRAPFSGSTENIREHLKKEFNYELVLWNLDTEDWYHNRNISKSFYEYEQKMGRQVKSNETSFIAIHHDPLPKSGELAKMAIDFVLSKGYKLVTVGQCIGVSDYEYVK